jgi:NAD(P)-dependent dehydrogenase (short-subunit alcohol dehydrogenase family)
MLCAGVSAHVPFEQTKDLNVYHTIMNVNYFGYLYSTFYALPHLKQSHGSIGVVCSLSGDSLTSSLSATTNSSKANWDFLLEALIALPNLLFEVLLFSLC